MKYVIQFVNRFIILLLFIFTIIEGFSTAQSPDYLIYEGDTFKMHNIPLTEYIDNHPNPIYDSLFRSTSTGNYRGYVAFWEIKNDSLFLLDITVEDYTIMDLKPIDKSLVFKDIDASKKIFANWVTEDLETVFGDMLFYLHSGFSQYYRYERIFSIYQGKVKSISNYDNSNTYLPFEKNKAIVNNYLIQNTNYQNIKDVPQKPIVVFVTINKINADGTIREVEAFNNNNYPQDIIDEAERVVKSIPRYDVLYHHGEPEPINHFLLVRFSDSLRRVQADGPIAPIDPFSDEQRIIDKKQKLQAGEDIPYYANSIGNSYYNFVIDISKLTPEDTRYDDLYLKMYNGDSIVLWHHRLQHAADSALKYLYLNWQTNPFKDDRYFNYYHIIQLEHLLNVEHNPIVQLPKDSDGCYFSYDLFLNPPANWMNDLNIDPYNYFNEPRDLKDYWASLHKIIQEPSLNQGALPNCIENLRFTLRRGDYPPIVVRVDFTKKQATLHWKQCASNKTRSFFFCKDLYIADEGSRQLNMNEIAQLRKLILQAHFESQPVSYNSRPSTQWMFEYSTKEQFNAVVQSTCCDELMNLGNQLLRWTGLSY